MGLLSFFQRKANPAATSGNQASTELSVQQLRVRARRRLIGAAVLVGLGVIGFPLVFETQPRPIPVDLPIEIPKKDGAPPLAIPQPAPSPAASVAAVAPSLAPAVTQASEPRAEAPREVALAPARSDKPAESAVIEKPVLAKAHERPAVEKTAEKPGDRPEVKSAKPSASAAEAARVQALLDGGKPAAAAAAPGNGRFVVQVGAYADSKSAQDARMKLERMGLKTYVQAVETKDGKRIRVRVGPYASREEADRVAGKVRDSGLSTAVLSL